MKKEYVFFVIIAALVLWSKKTGNMKSNNEASKVKLVPSNIKNNNPGNLRGSDKWKGRIGTDKNGFVIFDTLQSGARAMVINAVNNMKQHKTLRRYIYDYAPPTDNNDTANYLKYLVKATGVDADAAFPIQTEYIARLCLAQFKMEHGTSKVSALNNPLALFKI